MKEYIVKYIDKDGDLCSVWVEATNREVASYRLATNIGILRIL